MREPKKRTEKAICVTVSVVSEAADDMEAYAAVMRLSPSQAWRQMVFKGVIAEVLAASKRRRELSDQLDAARGADEIQRARIAVDVGSDKLRAALSLQKTFMKFYADELATRDATAAVDVAPELVKV